jgi:mono/diheme cytochrome c family protein
MKSHPKLALSLFVFVAVLFLFAAGLARRSAGADNPNSEVIASGERLVHLLDCTACHTPKVMTPKGPQPDSSRLLSGQPADEKLPAVPEGVIGPTGWGGVFNGNQTAWAGPWGVSFATNLTPDMDTGIGGWTEEMFVEAMRTGRHVEDGSPFLPPMPTYALLTDNELHAVFTYLKSIKPVANKVPEALPAPKPGPNK